MSSETALIELVRQCIVAENDCVTTKAATILAGDFTAITRARGEEQDRSAMLKEIANPPNPALHREADAHEFWVQESGDLGVVRSLITTTDRTNRNCQDAPKRFRNIAVLAILTLASLAVVAKSALRYEPPTQLALSWGIARLSAAVAISALLLLASRIIWNYANIWLGRAGTLEDLGLALKLMGINPATLKALNGSDTQQLLQITESLERLRRSFEGDLLKGPSLEVPKAK